MFFVPKGTKLYKYNKIKSSVMLTFKSKKEKLSWNICIFSMMKVLKEAWKTDSLHSWRLECYVLFLEKFHSITMKFVSFMNALHYFFFLLLFVCFLLRGIWYLSCISFKNCLYHLKLCTKTWNYEAIWNFGKVIKPCQFSCFTNMWEVPGRFAGALPYALLMHCLN